MKIDHFPRSVASLVGRQKASKTSGSSSMAARTSHGRRSELRDPFLETDTAKRPLFIFFDLKSGHVYNLKVLKFITFRCLLFDCESDFFGRVVR
jgi:hypothetical protein